MTDDQQYWRVELWLGDQLVEEHVAPASLAEHYANVIRLRIQGLPGRRLRCEPLKRLPLPDPRSSAFSCMVADNHSHIMRKEI